MVSSRRVAKKHPFGAGRQKPLLIKRASWARQLRHGQAHNSTASPPSQLSLSSEDGSVILDKVVNKTRWQEQPPCDSADFEELGNSYCEYGDAENGVNCGVESLRCKCSKILADQASKLTCALLREVPLATVWKSTWDAILFIQKDSFQVFTMFAALLQKHSDFQCHHNGPLHPTRELTARVATLRGLLLRGRKSRHRIESVAQQLTVSDVGFLELGLKDVRNELILNYTRDDMTETALNALSRLRSLTVVDLRFVDVRDATLTLWRNALLRGEWPNLKVVFLGQANADKISYFMEIPQLWYIGYRGERLVHPDWFTCQHNVQKQEIPDRLKKSVRCALNHPSSWLLSCLKELHEETLQGKLILEINFCTTPWDLSELRRKPPDYVHCIRIGKSKTPTSIALTSVPSARKRQATRKREANDHFERFFG